MTSSPGPGTNYFPEDSLEKKVYNLVNSLKEYLPIENDRNRLGYTLFKYLKGEGDKPEILLKTTKVKIEGISEQELAKKLNEGVEKIK